MSAIRYLGPNPPSTSSLTIANQRYVSEKIGEVALSQEDVRGIITDIADERFVKWGEVSSFFSDKPRKADLPSKVSSGLVTQAAKGGFEGVATRVGGGIDPIQLPPVNVYSETKFIWDAIEFTARTTSAPQVATENVICEIEVDAPGYAWYPMIFGSIPTRVITGETNPVVTVLDESGARHALGEGSNRRDLMADAGISPSGQPKLFSPNENAIFYCFVHLRQGTSGTIEYPGGRGTLSCCVIPAS